MELEDRSSTHYVKTINIDLVERSITFEAGESVGARLKLTDKGVLLEILRHSPITERSVERLVASDVPEGNSTAERIRPVTVTGRLKSQPREGRPDSQGRPTAWARLAVHEEGHQDARLYSATFHRHTAGIALSLPKDAQITVRGYAHPSGDPTGKRLDTFSVINIVNYSGKPTRL